MDEFIQIIEMMQRRINQLERLVQLKNIELPTDGKFVLPTYTADPASGTNGQQYYNSTTNKIRAYENGAWIDLV